MTFLPKHSLDLDSNPLIGMVHLPPFKRSYKEILKFSLAEAKVLKEAKFDAILIENFHDVPFPKERIPDEKLLIMGLVISEIISQIDIPCGVNILRNACVQALSVATITQASFIRCNIYEGVYITSQGFIEGAAYEVQKKKHDLGSEVKILADIHVKHATPLGQVSLVESAKNALGRGCADAIIVSGKETGKIINLKTLKTFVESFGIKPILGSGLTLNNLDEYHPFISGAMVGTFLKTNVNDLSSPIDSVKAKDFAIAWNKGKY